MQTNILTVYREWQNAYNQTTILKDEKNRVKAIISSSLKQPRSNQKQIKINGKTYILDWSKVKI